MEHCAFDCLACTAVQVFPQSNVGSTKALANIVLNDQLIIRGLRVVESSNGLYVSFPKELRGDTPRAVLFPVTRQLREHIENCVLEKYQAAIGSNKAPERDDRTTALVKTTDYNNNGETLADSEVILIDSHEVCMERLADIKDSLRAVGRELHDERDAFFWTVDPETEARVSYAVKASRKI